MTPRHGVRFVTWPEYNPRTDRVQHAPHAPDRDPHNDGRCLFCGAAWMMHPENLRRVFVLHDAAPEPVAGEAVRRAVDPPRHPGRPKPPVKNGPLPLAGRELRPGWASVASDGYFPAPAYSNPT